MSILNSRFCRSIHRSRIASRMAAVLPVAILAACSDEILPTAPPTPTATNVVVGPGETAPDFLKGTVTCDLAVRSPGRGYRTKKAVVKVPQSIFDPSGRTTKFAYRGMARGSSDPTWLVLCQIPATAEALAHFEETFKVARAPDARANVSIPDGEASYLPQLAPRVTDPNATLYESLLAPCEPDALVDECDGGGDPGGEWEGPPPPDGDYTDDYDSSGGEGGYMLYGDDGVAAVAPAVISCSMRTDYPHASSHVFGMANVIGQTLCSVPVSQSISVTLSKQSCFWIFCWWSGRGYGSDGGFKTLVRANAAAPCSTGWWRGTSNHSMFFGFTYWPPWSNRTTWATNYLWC